MEFEGSLPYSQKSPTRPSPEAHEIFHVIPPYFFTIHSILSTLIFFHTVSPPKPCIHFISSSNFSRAQTMSFSFICSRHSLWSSLYRLRQGFINNNSGINWAEYVAADYDGSGVRGRLVTGMMFSPWLLECTPSCPTILDVYLLCFSANFARASRKPLWTPVRSVSSAGCVVP